MGLWKLVNDVSSWKVLRSKLIFLFEKGYVKVKTDVSRRKMLCQGKS